jgi:hypothetical protein
LLVDPDKRAAKHFKSRKKDISKIEAETGITIEFVQAKADDKEIVTRYAGQIDSIEYQYPNIAFQLEDALYVHKLLKPGGLVVYLSSSPIKFWKAPLKRNPIDHFQYKILLKRENIPAILQTPWEQNAFPLGNHVLVLQKPTNI